MQDWVNQILSIRNLSDVESFLLRITEKYPALPFLPRGELNCKIFSSSILSSIFRPKPQKLTYDEISKQFSKKNISLERIDSFTHSIGIEKPGPNEQKEHPISQILPLPIVQIAVIAFSYFRIDGFTLSLYTPLCNLISRSAKIQTLALPILDRVAPLLISLSSLSYRTIVLTSFILQLIKFGVSHANPLSEDMRQKWIKGCDYTNQAIISILYACFALFCLSRSPSIPIALLSTFINYECLRHLAFRCFSLRFPEDRSLGTMGLDFAMKHIIINYLYPLHSSSSVDFSLGFSSGILGLLEKWVPKIPIDFPKYEKMEELFNQITITTQNLSLEGLQKILEVLNSTDLPSTVGIENINYLKKKLVLSTQKVVKRFLNDVQSEEGLSKKIKTINIIKTTLKIDKKHLLFSAFHKKAMEIAFINYKLKEIEKLTPDDLPQPPLEPNKN